MATCSENEAIDWLVFGDDWGRHPSTTQHLVGALPDTDRVLWVGSLGMRAPTVSRRDLSRVLERVRTLALPRSRPAERAPLDRVQAFAPHALPWHGSRWVRAMNEVLLGSQLRTQLRRAQVRRPIALVTSPVAAHYLSLLDLERTIYLRLDDHPRLPGVDPELARQSEAILFAKADVCVATAETLARPGRTWHHLPQAVDFAHFASVPLELPSERILGFFGALAPWLDVALVEAVARRHPEWTLELVGPTMGGGARLPKLPNVRVLPPVPYAELPQLLARWRATWSPFVLDDLTRGVDPLKARESLAAGLPTLATALPALARVPAVEIVRDVDEVSSALASILQHDSVTARMARRESVAGETWAARARSLRRLATDGRRGS